jgi:hypothetical protein
MHFVFLPSLSFLPNFRIEAPPPPYSLHFKDIPCYFLFLLLLHHFKYRSLNFGLDFPYFTPSMSVLSLFFQFTRIFPLITCFPGTCMTKPISFMHVSSKSSGPQGSLCMLIVKVCLNSQMAPKELQIVCTL